MRELQIFNNPEFGEIRTAMTENGEPLLHATDIAKALGYENPNEAILIHCKSGNIEKRYIPHSNGIGGVNMMFIPEFEVYRLIMRSKLPTAEIFQDWVCEEVLPSIRKHGMYATESTIENIIANPDNAIKIFQALKEEKEKRILAEKKAKEQEPKVLFANAVATSERSILIHELAKLLKQNGIEIGGNRLFDWLRKNGYLCNRGDAYNIPTQHAMELHLFELKKTTINKPDGSILVSTTPKVTGKGQIYFVNKFLKSSYSIS